MEIEDFSRHSVFDFPWNDNLLQNKWVKIMVT